MTLIEKVKEATKASLKYHREGIKEAKSREPTLEKLAQILEPEISDAKYAYVNSDSITIDFKTIREARELALDLLGKVSGDYQSILDKFKKEASSGADGLNWYFVAKVGGVKLSIGPAEPDRKCVPVRREYTNHYWVCEKRR